MAAEATTTGMRLVAIDERGDRQFELLTPANAKDIDPAISPDGTSIVFSSTRGGAMSNLWMAKLGVEVAPVRLTEGTTDSHPTWAHDGKSIVFASTRDGGDFDLWRMTIENRAVEQLTNGEGHEVTPAIAPDGTIIYAAIDAAGASHIEALVPDGSIAKLTPGPDEREPAISPDGKTILFVSHVVREGRRRDAELWRMPRGGTEAKQLVDLPPTDESGPIWSPDGRFVFATSLVPADPKPVFASIVFVDLDESPPHVRLLRDSAGAIARVTPAIATRTLDADTLRRDPLYLPELANIMAEAIAKQRMQQP